MATAAQRDFARSIYAAAQKATDIAPEFVTAQAILESGWGKSRIGKFNLFGITRGSNWKGHTVLILTHEYFNTPNRTFTAPEAERSCPSPSAGPATDGITPFTDYSRTSIPLRSAFRNIPACSASPVMPMPGPTATMPRSSPAASATTRAASMPPHQSISSRCCR